MAYQRPERFDALEKAGFKATRYGNIIYPPGELPSPSRVLNPLHAHPHTLNQNGEALQTLSICNFTLVGGGVASSPSTYILASISGWPHIIGGGMTMLLGPIQFIDRLRWQWPWIHRWIGRAYVAAIFAGGLGGLQVSLQSMAYPIGDYGLAVLAIIWLATIIMGVFAIWNGDISGHRDWMTRNFSLTYAAVILRWQLPLLIVSGMTAPGAYGNSFLIEIALYLQYRLEKTG
ncbi:hypothetical protein BDW59DRAFT_165512 [Aspergillus cavernicola]|uniref:DUF2306 domain-containing protein n=1 Tax=Aspergillus cavernicola TaxID=176166 RepID=A0ABR4HSH0_9EURO